MKTLRFGAIGCGGMGRLHTMNARHIPGMDVVAYADLNLDLAESLLRDCGGEYATTSMQRLFDDTSLDGVFIITGEKFHPSIGIAAANAGKHIFMEKPIAITVEEALELERAVRRNNVKYLIGFCLRLSSAVEKARAMIDRPLYSITHSSSTVSGQTCHHLDLLLHLFHNAPVQSVYASGGHYYDMDPHLPADSFTATIKFQDGSQASLTMHGRITNAVLGKYTMQLFGQDRCVYLGDKYKEVHLCAGGAGPQLSYKFQGADFRARTEMTMANHYTDPRGPIGYMGHYEELLALCYAIRHDTEPPMTVAHGRHVLQVEKAILESLSTNQLIDFPTFLKQWPTP